MNVVVVAQEDGGATTTTLAGNDRPGDATKAEAPLTRARAANAARRTDLDVLADMVSLL